MNLFVLYPHIYVRKNDEKILFYDTFKYSHIIFPFNKGANIEFVSDNIISITPQIQFFLDKLSNLNFGYYLSAKTSPISFNKFNFTTSREKINTALSYNDGRSLLSTITKVSIYIDNTNILFDNDIAYSVLSFPKHSISDISNIVQFLNENKLDNLEHIELVSSLTHRAINFAELLVRKNIIVSFRSIINNQSDLSDIISFASKNKEIIFTIYLPLENFRIQDFYPFENVSIIPFSSNIDEIIASNINNVFPLIYDRERHHTLIDAVKISPDDILSRKLKLYDLRLNMIINRQFWGSIILDNDKVFSGSQFIGTFNDFKIEFSRWYYNKSNNWFLCRASCPKCKKCIFVDLCPSISLMEELKIINSPCKI